MKLMTPFLTTITACAWMTVPCSRYWQDTAQSAPAILLQQPSKCGMAMREFPRRIEDGRILCEQFKTSMRMGMTRRCITPICNLMQTLQVAIDRNATAEYPFPDSEIATFAERPTPAVTSGKITKVAKVNGTWLIWFNGEEAYCCTHGANGQPASCPPYTYVNTSTVSADQCVPGDHYGNQIRIWGGLNQLSLGDADDLPTVFSADEGEEISLLDFCASIYDDVQMYIIENFPESTAAEIYLASADELANGVETYASARGYYTYIYNPGRAGWQTVALIGPEIGEEEPEPEPVVQEYYASWEAPAQTASGSFDFSYGIRTDKIQLKTQEKVDGATIEIEPITKSGSIDGGSWSVSPACKQTVTSGLCHKRHHAQIHAVLPSAMRAGSSLWKAKRPQAIRRLDGH